MPPSDPPQLPVTADDIVDTVREPLLVLDAGLRVRRANRSFYQSFAVASPETLGRLIYELGNGQWDIPALRTLLEDVLPARSSFDGFEVVHDFPSIGRRVMLLNARRVRGNGTHEPSILLAIEDITERRRLEDERREIETRFTSLVKNVRDHSIFALDPRGHVTSWNVEAERILGFSEAEVLGRHFSFIFTAEDRRDGIPEHELRTALSDGRAEDERWHVRNDGEPFWALGIVTPIFDAGGKHTGFSKILRDMTDRKRAEEVLTESERRFRALAMASGAVLYQLSADWSELQPLDGKGLVPSNDKPIRDWFERNVAPADHAVVRERIAHAIATKTPFEMEHRVNRPDGSTGWTFSRAVPLLDAGGAITEWVGAASDVTERREAEAALRTSEERLAFAIEAGELGTFYCPMPLGTIIWNAKCKEHFWLPSDAEVTFDTFYAILHPDDRERTRLAVEQAVFERRPYDIEYRTVAPDGRTRWVRAKGRAYYGADGQPTRFDGVTLDITEEKRTEAERQALLERERAARAEAETLVRVGRALSGELDLHKLVQAATDAATELAGAAFGAFFYNVPDSQGGHMTLYTISGVPREEFSKFPMPRATDLFGPTLKGEAVVRSDDITADPRYGNNAPYHGMPQGHLPVRSYLAVPVRSRSGEVLGAMFFGHPEPAQFTERQARLVDGVVAQAAVAIDNSRLYERERAARNDAERASGMKDEFLATLSHELRTPLNAILGWAQILQSGTSDAEDLRQGLDTIARNARAQTQIIEDLLDMSRIISGKVRLDVQRVDLAAVVQAAVDTLRPAAEAKGVRLQVVLDPHAGPVSGDPSRLQQVFWNLLTNAVKFTPRGGRVQVVLERVNSHLEVSVTDTGEGIAAEFLPHVFDRFRQADASTTRRHGGLGLGLAIVKQLVELHGGTVHAKSPGVGKGATFRVALPLTPLHAQDDGHERRHPKSRHDDAPRPKTPTLAGVRVLVVDDEPDSRALVKRLLENCDATAAAAGSVNEAIAMLDGGGRFDVIVSDIGMPERDGFDLIRTIRRLPASEGGKTPAVALTAYARSDDRTRAILAGFDMHIAKPVEPSELCAVVARLAGRTG